MKLVGSVIVRNELSRYLPTVLDHLLEFCDEIRVLDDRSDDGTSEWLAEQRSERVQVRFNEGPTFFEHEGRARQMLLHWTLQAMPTHVLAIDADELVSDGTRLRSALSENPRVQVWKLSLAEVWQARPDTLRLRVDGAWRPRWVPLLWRVPSGSAARRLAIRDRALACGREPEWVRSASSSRHRSRELAVDLLHLGWANEAERAARHARYVTHDGGNFHARRHLDSILWPQKRVRLVDRPWPEGLAARRDAILAAANRPVEVAA